MTIQNSHTTTRWANIDLKIQKVSKYRLYI
jgi:hypothetical protein